MERVLAESNKFIVTSEYEEVYLNFKDSRKRICIGDFYGDPESAAISDDESFCAMAGYGLIIYYLKEPFEAYRYHVSTDQWDEFFRDKGRGWWIADVKIADNSVITFYAEQTDTEVSGRYEMKADSHVVCKCV